MIISYSANLLMRSKLKAIEGEVEHRVCASPEKLQAALAEGNAELICIDLEGVKGSLEEFVSSLPAELPKAGFGSHVNHELLQQAEDLGLSSYPRSKFFSFLADQLRAAA